SPVPFRLMGSVIPAFHPGTGGSGGILQAQFMFFIFTIDYLPGRISGDLHFQLEFPALHRRRLPKRRVRGPLIKGDVNGRFRNGFFSRRKTRCYQAAGEGGKE
ncbi:hypothetical protein, partial [uncultured Akkermansia sp.]|uniref:hypothetical protein n=1 Tax=uncultured Akkermansia sp. TaxID=512294 RepID=UPI00266F291F